MTRARNSRFLMRRIAEWSKSPGAPARPLRRPGDCGLVVRCPVDAIAVFLKIQFPVLLADRRIRIRIHPALLACDIDAPPIAVYSMRKQPAKQTDESGPVIIRPVRTCPMFTAFEHRYNPKRCIPIKKKNLIN